MWAGIGDNWQSWGNLIEGVKTGETAFDLTHGMSLFEKMEDDAPMREVFDNFMAESTNPDLSPIIAAYDFSKASTIVDVGGGYGQMIVGILKQNPEAHGILLDMPSVIEGAKDRIMDGGVSGRCELVGGSFFDSVPSGDLLVIKSVLSNWNDDDVALILSNCRKAIESDGKLVVISPLIPGRNEGSWAKQLDIAMLAVTGGQGRTEIEFANLLGSNGFKLTRTIPISGPPTILEAVPV